MSVLHKGIHALVKLPKNITVAMLEDINITLPSLMKKSGYDISMSFVNAYMDYPQEHIKKNDLCVKVLAHKPEDAYWNAVDLSHFTETLVNCTGYSVSATLQNSYTDKIGPIFMKGKD